MKQKIFTVLVGVLIITGFVLYLRWDADRRTHWEQKYIKGMANGENPYELVFRWNQTTLNPFTWKKPSTDKLVLGRPREVLVFKEEGLLIVPVLVLLNPENLKLKPSSEVARFQYVYNVRSNLVAMVATDAFGVPTEKEKFELLKKASQAQVIREWADTVVSKRSK